MTLAILPANWHPTLLATALTLLAGNALAEAPYQFATTPGKLPKDVIPLHYAIHLQPDLANQKFKGEETIEIQVLATTRRIMLNVAAIEIDSASLQGAGLPAQALQAQIDSARQTVQFALPQALKPGRYQLKLAFRGSINKEDRGLFSVPDASGDAKRTVLATTLEPSDARRVIPSWDEPVFRAKFSLTVDVPKAFSAYSNTPVKQDLALPGDLHRVSFATTPKMASYLFVLVAGDLRRTTVRQDGVEIGIVAQPEKIASGQFASQSSQALVRYYNQYFGIAYPLSKLDHIALPGTIHGAMENWGGIVYHERRLLWDAKLQSDEEKEGIFSIVAHETAHQWFGNLVTTAWWDNLWLNEGFASWMQAKASAELHPEWNSKLDDMLERENALSLDARASTHPIHQPIKNEEQAAAAFDSITYGKASAVLSMLESYIGPDAFRRGMRAYMRRHQYGNTTSADLWAAMDKASGKPVSKVATGWITQAGLPLVRLQQRCQNGQSQITLSQQPFVSDNREPGQQLWQIPLQLSSIGGKPETILLSTASTTLQRAGCQPALLLDPQGQGYFRVQYDSASFQALSSQVNTLPDAARLKLLNDAWALVTTEKLPLASYLTLFTQLKNEPSQTIWSAMLIHFANLDKLARNTPQQQPLRHMISQLLLPQMAQLGWDEKPGEARETRLKRSNFIQTLVQIGDSEALAAARSRFARLLQQPDSLVPGDKEWVLHTVGMYADASQYQQLLELGRQASNNSERNLYYGALLSARDPQLAEQSLQLALQDGLPADISSRVVPSVAHSEHTEQAWNFAIANRDALLKHQGSLRLNRYFPSIMNNSLEVKHAKQLEQFAKQFLSEEAQIEARRVSEGIRLQAKRKQTLLPQLAQALQGQSS